MDNTEALKKILASYDYDSKGHCVGERDRGTGFEYLCKLYLENDKEMQQLYSDVYFVEERDLGWDLVGIRRDGSGKEAIQCKFYEPQHKLQLGDKLDRFLNALTNPKNEFVGGMLISTNELSSNAQKEFDESPVDHIWIKGFTNLVNSSIDWSQYAERREIKQVERKTPYPKQKEAIASCVEGLKNGTCEQPAKGCLFMACGTGKTFTSLKIAENNQVAGSGSLVLFLAPSLQLISQTIREWTQQTDIGTLNCFSVCSDSEAGKTRDEIGRVEYDLEYPATTNPKKLVEAITQAQADPKNKEKITVIFSTYQSSEVVSLAQSKYGLQPIDLMICDEAHRTSGSSRKKQSDEDEGAFQLVHSKKGEKGFINRKRSLYMTATPRVYSGEAVEKAEDADITIYSMDNKELYGDVFYKITFADAVRDGRLCPYKVVILGVPEREIRKVFPEEALGKMNKNLTIDIASRIIGTWKALSREDMRGEEQGTAMKRAVAFCSTIDPSTKRKGVASTTIEDAFSKLIQNYQKRAGFDDNALCQVRHIDGRMNAIKKGNRIQWLKDTPDREADPLTGQRKQVCRILSNVRCLSEGVDVPSLDAVIFLHPRTSEIDIVQSVGRVMRTAPGKKRGYIIIPVVVPEGKSADEYFTKSKDNPFGAVWKVLQALRCHDSTLDNAFDNMKANGTEDTDRMEIICPSSLLTLNSTKSERRRDNAKKSINPAEQNIAEPTKPGDLLRRKARQMMLDLRDQNLEKVIYAKTVSYISPKNPFSRWSEDVSNVVKNQILNIKRLLKGSETDTPSEIANRHEANRIFDNLRKEIRTSISPTISDETIIDMLGQHLVTGPIFHSLFSDEETKQSNPITQALNEVMKHLHNVGLAQEQQHLSQFFETMRERMKGATPKARQQIANSLYNDFFAKAFKSDADKLGVVYTPIPIVDFILRSVENVLQEKFGKGMGSKGVSVLDPFTGTGTFMYRLLGLKNEDGNYIIPDESLPYKYKSAKVEEASDGKPALWANEIMLLPYYIASINISAIYKERTGETVPFGGLCLTDTFNLTKNVEGVERELGENENYLKSNSERIVAQEKAKIKVVIGNPPYSKGAKSTGKKQNERYEPIRDRIRQTYAKSTSKGGTLYDSYIKAFRWASDRIGKNGVIGFVTNGGWLERSAGEGVRRSFENEFSDIFVFNLRGDIKRGVRENSREILKKEGSNVFGQASSTGVSVTVLVRDEKTRRKKARIRYCDIGDYLRVDTRFVTGAENALKAPSTDKYYWINRFGSFQNIPRKVNSSDNVPRVSQDILPDKYGDWLHQRDENFENFLVLGDNKSKKKDVIFSIYSLGVATNRDAWVWNFSDTVIQDNILTQTEAYEEERSRLNCQFKGASAKEREEEVKQSPNFKTKAINWSLGLRKLVASDNDLSAEDDNLQIGSYRPYTKQWLFFSRNLNEITGQQTRFFPNSSVRNKLICVTPDSSNMSCLMVDCIPDLELLHHGQCFPFYWYEKNSGAKKGELFQGGGTTGQERGYTRYHAITDIGLKHFQEVYGEDIAKEDLFYYVYGLLHSEDYKKRYKNNLAKELPRIPRVKSFEDFKAFEKAGRELADLHVNYEDQEPYFSLGDKEHLLIKQKDTEEETYRIKKKMKFSAEKGEKDTPSILIYNENIRVIGIPEEAYDYVVGGKPALRWIVERYYPKTDKRSEITNDPNRWAVETAHDPKYVLELFLKVITVSMRTREIVKNLPELDVLEDSK